jgi:hypothetical protein
VVPRLIFSGTRLLTVKGWILICISHLTSSLQVITIVGNDHGSLHKAHSD